MSSGIDGKRTTAESLTTICRLFDEFEDGDFVAIHALDHLGKPDEVEGADSGRDL